MVEDTIADLIAENFSFNFFGPSSDTFATVTFSLPPDEVSLLAIRRFFGVNFSSMSSSSSGRLRFSLSLGPSGKGIFDVVDCVTDDFSGDGDVSASFALFETMDSRISSSGSEDG